MNAIIYARVSTSRQDVARQIQDLRTMAERHNYTIVREFSETVSGTSKFAGRQEAQELFECIIRDDIKCVFITEISRLGRSTIDVQNTVEKLVTDLKCNVYIQSYGMFLLDAKGKFSAMSRLLMDIMANFAQMEKEQLVERIHSGLAEAKRKGVQLGRPKGKSSEKAFLKRHASVVTAIQSGMSVKNAAAATGAGLTTAKRVRKILASQPTVEPIEQS